MKPNQLKSWTEKEVMAAVNECWKGVCEECLCDNSLDTMKTLESLGMVKLLDPPSHWPEAQYGYVMTDKGEAAVKEYHRK